MPSASPAADIMDALLRGENETPFPGEQALARLIRRAAAPLPLKKPAAPRPLPPQAEAGPAPPLPHTPRPRKRKATHYLDAAVAARLDAASQALSGMAADSAGPPRRVAKSAVVEAALALALADFEAEAGAAPLARRLLPRT